MGLLNEELTEARQRISSLENALVAAREAIRVLKNANDGSSIKVSVPLSPSPVSLPSNRRNTFSPSSPTLRSSAPVAPPVRPQRTPFRGGSPLGGILPRDAQSTPFAQAVPKGDATLRLRAEVQFLNNKNRPAGFTEFFLLQEDLDSVLKSSRIRIPGGQGIDSFAELWARWFNRISLPWRCGSYSQFLGLFEYCPNQDEFRGQANLSKLKAGRYFVVGASTLGKSGDTVKPHLVTWFSLSLDLRMPFELNNRIGFSLQAIEVVVQNRNPPPPV